MIINDISSVTFSNHYKWNSFEAISQDFIEGLLIENENNPIFPNTKLSNKYLAEISARLICKFLYLIETSDKDTVIISRRHLCSLLKLDKNLVGYCLRTLENAGILSSTRKGTINGANKYSVNKDRLKEIENKGTIVLSEEMHEIAMREAKILEDSRQRIIANQEKIKAKKKTEWPEERTKAINEMAYDEIELDQEDTHSTGLHFYDRFLIQIISKAYYRYTGEVLEWNPLMLNKIRKTLTEESLTTSSPLKVYDHLSAIISSPQKIIDIVKFMTSIWFVPLTRCYSSVFEMRFADAYNRGIKYIIYQITGKSYESSYELFNVPEALEDNEYYLNKVNVNRNSKYKTRARDNVFNHINPDKLSGHYVNHPTIRPYLLEELKENYKKFNPEKPELTNIYKGQPIRRKCIFKA